MAGINLVHVPYGGGAPMVTDLIAGQVQVGFDVMVTSLPQIRTGALRALGVAARNIDSITENGESAASIIACAKATAILKSRRQEEVINMPPRTKSRSTQVPAKIGRPSKYTVEWAEAFCNLIAEGKSVAEICARPDMPSQQSVYTWLRNDGDFLERYARAREAQADKFFKECIEIADAATQENCNVARLRVDTRKWAAARLAPKKYSDHITHDVKGGGIKFQPQILIQCSSGEYEELWVRFESRRIRLSNGRWWNDFR